MTHRIHSRRALLGWGLGGALVAACGRAATRSADAARAPTPAIADDDAPPPLPPQACGPATADNIEGPFFKSGAPHRAVLADRSMPGVPLYLGGRVLGGDDCRPLAGAEMEVWQANDKGEYDLEGWRLRGQLATDAGGAWSVTSIVPGRYLNGPRYRPRHVHIKLHAAGHRPLTTQLYFPGDPYNDGDAWFLPELQLAIHHNDSPAMFGAFDFVLPAA